MNPLHRLSAAPVLASALAVAIVALPGVGSPASTTDDGGHGVGRMGLPAYARVAATTTVDPTQGPDFEMPFPCGQVWTGTTRSSHSPSPWTIDFNYADGDLGKPALASTRGVVIQVVHQTDSYGNHVVIDHGNGYSTLYAHLQSTQVAVGQVVDQGTLIGYVGGTGNVTGPHLHFEERLNGRYFHPYFHRTSFTFGRAQASQNCPDYPIAGDWDGDTKTELGVFRPSPRPSASQFRARAADGATTATVWGDPGDVPVIGDWDGDGKAQLGERVLGSRRFTLRSQDGATLSTADMGGLPRDLPLAGHFGLSPKYSLGYYHVDTHTFTYRRPDLKQVSIVFGNAGDQPVIGDWNGNKVADVGTFTASSGWWHLRTVKNGHAVVTDVKYGVPWDIPVTGDWNGDGTTDIGVWRPSTATFYLRTATPTTGGRNATVTTTPLSYGTRRH